MTKKATARETVALQSWLRPALAHVGANKDYAQFRAQLDAVDALLRRSHLESMALDFAAEGMAQASTRQQVARRQFALKALRVEVLRMLLGNPSFRQFSRTVAASDLLADFCGVRRLDGITGVSKSTLVVRPLDGETAGFPLVAQAARVHRQRTALKPETVELITSRPAAQLSPAQWLEANINHWGIETGLHARLDASRHDDRCRLRSPKAVWIHGMFNRWANSLLMHWSARRPNARHLTTTDFISHCSENHDRRAISAITSLRFPS